MQNSEFVFCLKSKNANPCPVLISERPFYEMGTKRVFFYNFRQLLFSSSFVSISSENDFIGSRNVSPLSVPEPTISQVPLHL